MKRTVTIIISIILTCCLTLNSFAIQQKDPEISENQLIELFSEELVTDSAELLNGYEKSEETTGKAELCAATIDMDFSDNEVLVVLSKEQSRQKQEYTANDFPELEIESIKCIMNYHQEIDNNSIFFHYFEK